MNIPLKMETVKSIIYTFPVSLNWIGLRNAGEEVTAKISPNPQFEELEISRIGDPDLQTATPTETYLLIHLTWQNAYLDTKLRVDWKSW